jgi:hypothetical protein
MKKASFALLIPAVAAMMVVAGCGKKVTINTQNGNVTADIDTGTNSANININGSTLQTGDSVSLPKGFPTDVYVIDGTIKTAWSTPGLGYSASLTTTKSVNEAKSLYDTRLPADGWTIASSGVYDVHSAVVTAQKGSNRTVTVAISDTDGPTVVSITATESTATNTSTGD